MELIYERGLGLDVHKKIVVACLILVINGQRHICFGVSDPMQVAHMRFESSFAQTEAGQAFGECENGPYPNRSL